MTKSYRVLAIDGGGVRGLIPAIVLAELERISGKHIWQLFDLIAGTSTGGILALGLVKPASGGGAAYSAAELAGLYEKESSEIFSSSWRRRAFSLWGLAEEKYPAEGFEDVLERYFGSTRLKDALTDVLVTGYEMERRQPFFFRSRRARLRPDYDFSMAEAARATAAAPSYFEPARIAVPGAEGYYALLDGGVFANNPAMCAFADALAEGRRPEEILLVSLGTGQSAKRILYDEAKGWGAAKWMRPFLHLALDGAAAVVDYHLRQILAGEDRRYWRFQPVLPEANEAMDNAGWGNLRALRLLAEDLIRDKQQELEQLATLLVDRQGD